MKKYQLTKNTICQKEPKSEIKETNAVDNQANCSSKTTVNQSINQDSFRGSIFDESKSFQGFASKNSIKNELSFIIDDLSIENKDLGNKKIEEILFRLKEIRKKM